jgi:hypothetical protein
MRRSAKPATAVRYPQIELEEVTRRRLHESPLVSAPDKEALMSTTTTSSRTSYVQWLIESRPPSLVWSRSTPPQPNQPPLDLTDQEANDAEVAASDNRGVRVVKAGWVAQQRPGLPDARKWSTTLALALIQALLGRRPVAQATRWKRALAMVSLPLEPSGMHRSLSNSSMKMAW